MGDFLIYLKKKHANIRLYAIESSIYCIENLKNQNIEVIAENIEEHWHENHKMEFDLIVMRHVFEHFLYPLKVLEKVKKVLSQNGIIYIAVPDMMNPKGRLKKNWFRIVHFTYFSTVTLMKMINKSGLNILKLDLSNHELYTILNQANSSGFDLVNNYSIQKRVISWKLKKEFVVELLFDFPKKLIIDIRNLLRSKL